MTSREHIGISVCSLAQRQGAPSAVLPGEAGSTPPEQDLKELRAGAVPRSRSQGAEDTAGASRALGRQEKVSQFARLISW